MASPDNLVVIYKELADWHERQGQPQLRDRFLVLAADAALAAGRAAEADLLLLRLLRANPHHMLRPFASFAEAVASPDVQNYVAELRRTYPPEKAEEMFDAMRTARAARKAAPPIPPTAPVVDLDSDEPPPGREPLKVYRVQDEADAPPAPRGPRPTAARPPAPPPPRPAPPRPSRPVPLPHPAESEPPPPPPSPADGEDAPAGNLVSTGLFVILLAAAAALAGYTVLAPFFHQ
jgi:hypothetical protein